jgi:hypothetical protein
MLRTLREARLLADRADLSPRQLEVWITATPSCVDDASAPFADYKVAFVQSIAPAVSTAIRTAAMEP